MTEKRDANQLKTCPSCGAQVVSEICAYCGTPTGLNTADADMEYPVLECKEATVNFFTLLFPLIFALAFGGVGVTLLIVRGLTVHGDNTVSMIGIPFLLIGLAAAYFVIRTLSRYIAVKTRGKRIVGTVYGYMDDNVLINNKPAQIVKLLVQTADGPRFLLYQLGDTLKLYGIHDTVELMVYKDYFLICKNKQTVRW